MTNEGHHAAEGDEGGSRVLDEVGGLLCHDLRTPLTVAQGRLKLAREEVESEHHADIGRALDRMEDIVDNVLLLVRTDGSTADPEPLSLRTFSQDCWTPFEPGPARLEVVDELVFEGNRALLSHVFDNLFTNAVEHCGENVVVRIGTTGPTSFYVEDDGPGISVADHETVFDSGHGSSNGGVGYGLTIVRQFVELHGWSVSVTEGSAGGARFEFAGIVPPAGVTGS